MILHRDHKHLQSLIDFAVREGWTVSLAPDGHLKLTKQGLPPIYTGVMPDDHHASHAHTTREADADG